jgi:hypothetical protein
MAAQSLVEQSLVFISANGQYDQDAIFASSLIQTLAVNSAGNDLLFSYEQFANWNSTTSTWGYQSLFRIRCYVQPTFVATILSNIANLQAAFPQYTIITYGISVSFGS